MTCRLQRAELPSNDFDMELGWDTDFFSAFTNDDQYAVNAKQEVQQNGSGLGAKIK